MSIAEQAPPSEADVAAWMNELRQIQLEQHEGKWNFTGDEKDAEAMANHAEYVRSRVRRGIELTALLRRSNTGPAKPGGKRAGRKAPPIDLQAVEDELLG